MEDLYRIFKSFWRASMHPLVLGVMEGGIIENMFVRSKNPVSSTRSILGKVRLKCADARTHTRTDHMVYAKRSSGECGNGPFLPPFSRCGSGLRGSSGG